MIPKGVTVRKMGEPPRQMQPNGLWAAANCDNRTKALWDLSEALGLPADSPLASIHLSESPRWARLSPCSRLMEIAAWLKAECYEAMDLVESAPVSTVGD